MVLVLDNEKKEDHEYGEKFPQLHPEINASVCYMNPYPNNVDFGWGKARQYLDMLHADRCTNKEYIGFVDADTMFATAVTEDMFFEEGKPVVIATMGTPHYRCWIEAAEYVLQVKQVFQCMSNFPVTFKVSHIVEMRKYVERMHNNSFDEVFKESRPEGCPITGEGSWCHYSMMCNYMWYYHRDEYSWHLQLVPLGNWDGKKTIPALVQPNYLKMDIKDGYKIPKPRPAVHARHLYEGGRRVMGQSLVAETNLVLREGLCHSFGFKLCPQMCLNFKETAMQEHLFRFEHYSWLWDKRCLNTQELHYDIVREQDAVQRGVDL
eukprot:gene12933-biopygen10310